MSSAGRGLQRADSWCLGSVSFSFLHLNAGYINYVQARHRGVEATVDHFVVRVSDGVQKSAPVPFYVIITPTNDEEPSLLLGNFSVSLILPFLISYISARSGPRPPPFWVLSSLRWQREG